MGIRLRQRHCLLNFIPVNPVGVPRSLVCGEPQQCPLLSSSQADRGLTSAVVVQLTDRTAPRRQTNSLACSLLLIPWPHVSRHRSVSAPQGTLIHSSSERTRQKNGPLSMTPSSWIFVQCHHAVRCPLSLISHHFVFRYHKQSQQPHLSHWSYFFCTSLSCSLTPRVQQPLTLCHV